MRYTSMGVALQVIALISLAAPAGAQVVVSNEYSNLSATQALADVPVTFSRIGAEGDFTKGITPSVAGKKLPAQVDVLRRAADGSIRHALVSFVLPALPAGGKVKLDWLNEAPPAPPAFVWAADRAGAALKLTLSPADGPALVSDAGRILGRDGAPSARVKLLHDGPVMKEYEVRDIPVDAAGTPDKYIEVIWRLRAFTGRKSVRVAAIVESSKDRPANARYPVYRKFAGVKLTDGGRTLYEEGPYIQYDQTRYRVLVWTDGPLEDIERRPNYDYWVKGRFVPKYRWASKATGQYANMTPAKVDATFDEKGDARSKPTRKQGILENGIIFWHMPRGGSRWDINPYPAWSVAYLLGGGSETYRRILHADGNGGGAFYMHIRHKGAPGYDVFSADAPKGCRIDRYTNIPDAVRPNLEPDYAHAPSLGYVSYLLTGDKFYGEELSFWASYQMGQNWKQMARSFAWSFRQVVDAAFIQPDDNPLKNAFTAGVERTLNQMSQQLLKSTRRVHSPPDTVFNCSGRMDWINCTRCSDWMYSWVVWSLGNAADKGFPQAKALRDWSAEYIIGFYTSKDTFKAPDGKVYTYDPRDAMPYSTAVALHECEIYTDQRGIRRVRLGKKIKDLDNYAEIWYWTKVNEDNAFEGYKTPGLKTSPDANGVWPLKEDGWGHGMYNWGKQQRWWAWHRYGAWVGMVAAVEGNVPNALEAWKKMTELAGPSEYGYEMVPRVEGWE